MTQIAKAGTLLSIESGCYSDYSVHGFYVVLTDFDPKAQHEAHQETRRKDESLEDWERERTDTNAYLAHLLRLGLLLEIPYGTIHTEDYGALNEFEYRPASDSTGGTK